MGLDRTGVFRGIPLECGIATTREKKLPQFVIRARLTEYYDQQEEQWFNYGEKEAEITAYLCLYGAIKKKGNEIGPTLSYDQVKKVFSWDGGSFAALANGNYSELQFQLRIGDNTYEEAKTPYQVDWIDEYDADPVRQLRKLDAKELKDLDKQYAKLLNKPVKAATAPKKPHPARVPADDGTPPTAEEKKAAQRAKSERIRKANEDEAKAKLAADVLAPPAPPELPEPVEETPEASTAVPESDSCSKQDAWETIYELREPTINDGTIKELWIGAIKEVAGPEAATKKGMKKVTEKQWFQIKEIVLKDCAKF